MEINNSMNEKMNAIGSISNKADQMEDKISDLEDRNIEIIVRRRKETNNFKKQGNPIRAIIFDHKGTYNLCARRKRGRRDQGLCLEKYS